MASRILAGLNFFLQTHVLGKNVPCLFGMVITDKCNLDCFYCESKNSGRYHFSFAQAADTIRDAFHRGHRTLYFTGGEPMLWEDDGYNLGKLVAFAREVGFLEVFVYTNGTRPLSIEQCKYVVTVDGPKEIHDHIRSNSYEQVLDNVRNAAGTAVFATITLTKTNAEFLEQYVKEITGTRLFTRISFNLLTHWPEIVAKYGLSTEGKSKILDRIWRLRKDGYPIALSRAAYKALKNNAWERPIPQIELGTKDKVFTCCRDIGNPSICANCGYSGCVEVSQILAGRPSAIWQALRLVSG